MKAAGSGVTGDLLAHCIDTAIWLNGSMDSVTAMTDPPQNTRAKGRSKLVEEILKRRNPKFYLFYWNGVALDRHHYFEMSDPFDTYENPTDQWQIPVK